MALTDHPLRRQVVGEMQLRRFPAFSLPARIVQIMRIVEDREAETRALRAIWPELDPAARHAQAQLCAHVTLGWERHSEASTMTLVTTGEDAPLDWSPPPETVLIEAVPGKVVRASRLLLVADDAAAQGLIAKAGFGSSHLVTCHVRSPSGTRARLWTDFRIHADGYGRIVMATGGMPLADFGRCVQQVQELGNYRNLALIGLPEARAAWSELDALEAELEDIGQGLARGDRRDDTLLASLIALSARLLSIDSGCGYRMSATAAYARIVASRMAQLDAEAIPGFQSLAAFNDRRFEPAVHTCAALTTRLALLNARTAQSTALLRTRIETHIENQNARLLASVDRSARMQVRLQRLVEGLSSVVISYYLLGLIGYPLKAAEHVWPPFHATLALGLLAPLVIALLSILMGRAHRRLDSDDKHPALGP